jgi:hypothetical protein
MAGPQLGDGWIGDGWIGDVQTSDTGPIQLFIQDAEFNASMDIVIIKALSGGTWKYEDVEKKLIIKEAEFILRQNEEILLMAKAFMEVI